MDLYKYKNIFGEPKTGVHKYRFMSLAIVDVIMTLIGAGLFSYAFKTPYWLTILIFFLSGIALHRLFSVRTTVDKVLFPNVNE
jgi:fatty acid desaturase